MIALVLLTGASLKGEHPSFILDGFLYTLTSSYLFYGVFLAAIVQQLLVKRLYSYFLPEIFAMIALAALHRWRTFRRAESASG